MNKCCGKEKSRGLEQLRIYGNVGQFVIFKGLIRIGLTDKVIFEQSFGKRVIYVKDCSHCVCVCGVSCMLRQVHSTYTSVWHIVRYILCKMHI